MSIRKIVTLEELGRISQELKSQGKILVTTNGTFDILHVGHKRALEQSKSFGDVLIVGVNSDSSVKQYKSDLRPIVPENDRAEMLAGLACVDYVVIFQEKEPSNFLNIVKPHIHTKGGEYDPEKLIETAIIKQNGGKVVKTDQVLGLSTTNIIKKIIKVYTSKT